MRASLRIAAAAALVALPALAASPAEELLAAAIAHHDPGSSWGSGRYRLTFEESRPDGSVRTTRVVIDFDASAFSWESSRQGRRLEGELTPGDCTLRLDGSTRFSAEERETFALSCERLERLRDYYTYLWGLPMKLRDPGARVAEAVDTTTFARRPVRKLEVTYDEEVGSDTWFFYFDAAAPELVGYRFYHDVAAGDGEYIVLEGIVESAGLRLPRRRTWYTNAADELLGVDTLVSLEALDSRSGRGQGS